VNSDAIDALLGHLWQSTLFVLAVGCLSLMLRKNSARIRYCLWLAASAKFLIPFAALTALGTHFPWPLPPGRALEPTFFSRVGQTAVQITQLGTGGAGALRSAAHVGGYGATMVALSILWVLGVLAVAARWFSRWRLAHHALHESMAMSLAFAIPVRSSSSHLEPAVVGVLRPVLLLPKDIEQRLSADEMKALLAHERCHVAWRDNLAASIHLLVEVLFWFHPLVWWVGTRLVDERERACDEHVLAQGHLPTDYAEGILKVCEHCFAPGLASISGISGANLSRRIEAIMRNRKVHRMGATRRMILGLAAIATIALPLALGAFASDRAQDQPLLPGDEPAFHNVAIELAPTASRSPPAVDRGAAIWLRPGGRVTLAYATLHSFIANAFGVTESQVVGRDWSHDPSYDITADDPWPHKQGDALAAALSDLPAMERSLLARNFGLVVRHERRLMTGYVLSVGSAGAKLTPYAGGPSWKTALYMSPAIGIDVTDYPIDTLTQFLGGMFKVPVVNQTGLTGHYEYKAGWKSSSPGAAPDAESVAKALQEQLGLRLEAKEMTVDVIDVVRLKPANQVVTGAANIPAGDSKVELAGQFSGMSVDDRHLLIGVSNNIYGFIDHVFLYTAGATGGAQMTLRDVPSTIDYRPGIGLRLTTPGIKNAIPGYALFFSAGGGISKSFADGSSTESKDMGASAGLTHYEMRPPLSTSEFWALRKIEACGTAQPPCIQVAGQLLPFPGG
jgi:bla regulator protein BlaR1